MPVFSFGENDVRTLSESLNRKRMLTAAQFSLQIFGQLRNERGTRLYKLQKRFQSVFGFTLRTSHRAVLPNCSFSRSRSFHSRSSLLRPGTLQLCARVHRFANSEECLRVQPS